MFTLIIRLHNTIYLYECTYTFIFTLMFKLIIRLHFFKHWYFYTLKRAVKSSFIMFHSFLYCMFWCKLIYSIDHNKVYLCHRKFWTIDIIFDAPFNDIVFKMFWVLLFSFTSDVPLSAAIYTYSRGWLYPPGRLLLCFLLRFLFCLCLGFPFFSFLYFFYNV